MKKRNSFLNIVNLNGHDCEYSLSSIDCDDLHLMFSPEELSILLTLEPNSKDTDIMLENMLSYFEEVELYRYCQVVFDEMNVRGSYDF